MLAAIAHAWPALLLAAGIVVIVGLAVLISRAPSPTPRTENEKYYHDASGKKHRFPVLDDSEGDVDLSLVVPSYNEEKRLPKMVEVTMKYLEERKSANKSFTYEMVIVDDGSKDTTYKAAMAECAKYGADVVRVLKFDKNRGKGGAVRLGMESTRGRRILMVDADAATEISDLQRLEAALDACEHHGQGVAIGSRAHLQEEAVAQRSFLRTVLMHGFHSLVVVLGGVRGVRDTQCGFKLFTRATARQLFASLHLERWCFDVELLYIAQQLSIPVAEVAVNWVEVDGSHLDPLWSAIEMFKDLLLIRLFYMSGVWRIAHPADKKSQ